MIEVRIVTEPRDEDEVSGVRSGMIRNYGVGVRYDEYGYDTIRYDSCVINKVRENTTIHRNISIATKT
jgi:hypothetical protein